MAQSSIGLNITLPIYNEDGTLFHGLELIKFSADSVVMSLSDKITGEVYYPNNELLVTMKEYVVYNGVKYILVNPPTIVREGMAADNSSMKGMTKYTFEFYHPMCQLSNFPFADVATSANEEKYLSESKIFNWIGLPIDYIAKLNKNLQGTEWVVVMGARFPADKEVAMSDVLQFSNNSIADAVKKGYDTWGVPYIVDTVPEYSELYALGKRFMVQYGLPVDEVMDGNIPYVFKMGQGVGLKNNSRTPRNNKIVTRIAGYGSEDNIPYGYPQIVWDGAVDDPRLRYPLYDGIVGGRYVKLINHPFTRKHLMPSIYSECVNKKVNPNARGYDPYIELVDYYDADEEYPNPINPIAPSYEIHEFEVKPEMDDGQSNVQILDAYPIDSTTLQKVDAWDDTMDDDGNYVQSYFKVTLPVMSFDLYACAAITQEMQINMRSGACLGCTFTVQVDWDDYKKNFYDENGDFAPDGEQRDISKYPKSNVGSIEIILKKENTTFGTLMPNIYQKPKKDDEFVVLGISLPQEYITNAEKRLDDEMKAFMLENNVYYYDYPLKFSEHFLRTRTDILSQLKPNISVRFEFACQEMSLYIKQLTIKYGTSVLPQYDITLTDDVDAVVNAITQATSDISHLSSLITMIRDYYNKGLSGDLSTKLSRIADDTANGVIGLLRGAWFGAKEWMIDRFGNATLNSVFTDKVQSSKYTGDGLFDSGYVLRYLEGKAKLVVDDIVCRGKFIINEIEQRIWSYVGGNIIMSSAGSTIIHVEYLDANGDALGYTPINSPWMLGGRVLLARIFPWAKKKLIQRSLGEDERLRVRTFRCYELSDNGTMQTRNWWKPGDIAMCETLNKVRDKIQSTGSYSGVLSNTVYLRRVTGVGSKKLEFSDDNKIYDYVDLSLTECDPVYNDWPEVGDVIIQRGSFTDEDRQGITTIEVNSDKRGLHVYDNLNGWSKDGKQKAFLGYDSTLKRGLLEVFGDCYIGAMGEVGDIYNGSTYIYYNSTTHQLDIKAHISASSSIGDEDSVEEYIGKVFAPTVVELTEQDLINQQNAKQAQGLAELWSGFATDVIEDLNKIKAKGKVGYHDKITIRNFCTSYAFYATAKEQADRYNLDTTALTAAYNANQLAYAKYTADTPAEIPIESDFDAFITFLTVWSNTLVAVANAAKNLASSALSAAQTAQAAADAMNYIKVALKQKTDIEGGLILSSIIALRDGNGAIWSGMNGVYGNGDTIAAWYGGSMTDKEKYPSAARPAQALFRMNGTGYLAGGNISWNSDGSGKVAGGNISWNANGVVNVNGSNVSAATFTLDGQNITAALKSLLGMFEMDGSWIKAKYSLYSVGEISMYSDKRLKDIQKEMNLDASDIANLSIIQFKWKERKDDRLHVGGIAQEIQKLLPEAVTKDKDGILAVNYDAVNFASVVSLSRKVVEQQQRIDFLETKMMELENRLSKIEYLNNATR